MSYHSPKDLTSALKIASGSPKIIIAGGTDIFPALKQGQPLTNVLDVTGISELCEISKTLEGIRFGAAVSWSDIANADLPSAFDALKQAAVQVGSIQIQNSGTIAGNICNASPAADGVPPLLALDAFVEVASAARGVRHLALQDFILGVRATALARDELVTAILVPTASEATKSCFEKLGSRKYLVISIAMVSAVISKNSDGRIDEARIAVGSCSAVAQRLHGLEADCIGKAADEIEVLPEHLAPLSPIDDVRGSADYRSDAVTELCARAIRGAI